MSSRSDPAAPTSVVIKISPMAHLAVGFFTLALTTLIFANPPLFAWLLIFPALVSAVVVRCRTTADGDGLTARSLIGSRTVAWEDVEGLRFDRGRWGSAHLEDGSDLRLPAVTFATLPLLTEASGGRVPNPYD